jgi:cobalamin biosynthesis Mg chelatase CobN
VTGISKLKAVRRGGFAVFVALLAAALLLPGSALAGECSHSNSDPTAAQYCSPHGTHENGNNGDEEQGIAGADESSGTETPVTVEPSTAEAEAVQESSSGSSLPFTGLDVGVLAIVALLLAATGLLLRRLSAPGDNQG